MTEQEIAQAKLNLETRINSELELFTKETGITVNMIIPLNSEVSGNVYYDCLLECNEWPSKRLEIMRHWEPRIMIGNMTILNWKAVFGIYGE